MMDESSRRQRRDRPGLEGNGCGPRSSSCLIGKPLPLGAGQDAIGPRQIVVSSLNPMGVAEVEFRKVPLQVLFGNVLVDTINTTLEDAEVSLDGVGVDIAANVFLGAVVDAAVTAFEVPADSGVDARFVSHKARVTVCMHAKDRAQSVGSDVRDVETADLSAPLYQRHDDLLLGDRTISPVLALAAQVGFVGFQNLASATQRAGCETPDFLHALADAVRKEPCGFHRAAQGPLELVGADALLAGRHQMDGLEPDMQGDVAGLEYASHPNRELFPARIALPETDDRLPFRVNLARLGALSGQPTSLSNDAAVRADRIPIGPEPHFDIGESSGLIVKMFSRKFGLHGLLLEAEH